MAHIDDTLYHVSKTEEARTESDEEERGFLCSSRELKRGGDAAVSPFAATLVRRAGTIGYIAIGAVLGACGPVIAGHYGALNTIVQPEELSVREKLELGLNKVAEWYPQDAPMLLQNKALILDHIINMSEPQAGSPFATQLHLVKVGDEHHDEPDKFYDSDQFYDSADSPMHSAHNPSKANYPVLHDRRLLGVNPSPCASAAGWVISDMFWFVTRFAGIVVPNPGAFRQGIAGWYQANLDHVKMKSLSSQIAGFNKAAGPQKAWVLWMILTCVWKEMAPVNVLFAYLRKFHVSPWMWIKAIIVMASQCIIWFSTSKTALLGDVTLSLTTADTLVADAKHAEAICSAPPPTPAPTKPVSYVPWNAASAASR